MGGSSVRSSGRYTLATLAAAGHCKSAPAHVARVRQLVFKPLNVAQQRELGEALVRTVDVLRADGEV